MSVNAKKTFDVTRLRELYAPDPTRIALAKRR